MAQLNSLLVTGDSRFLNPINGNARNGIYYVKGTQTASTNVWTGTIPIPALYDGLTIMYYLPYAGTSKSATLNLTLSDGTTTGAIDCYYSNSRLTTHYGKGCNIVMTYHPAGTISIDGTATTNNRWIANANYVDGNTKVTQTEVSTDADYEVLFSTSVSGSGTKTELSQKNTSLTFNPSNGLLSSTRIRIANTTNPSAITDYVRLFKSSNENANGVVGVYDGSGNLRGEFFERDGGHLYLSNASGNGIIDIFPGDYGGNIQVFNSSGTERCRLYVGANNDGVLYLKNSSNTTTILLEAQTGKVTCTTAKIGDFTYGVTSLYSGTLSSGSITFNYGSYKSYLIVGKVQSGGSSISQLHPKNQITTSNVSYVISDEIYYVTYYLKYSGTKVTLTFNSANDSGSITQVWGIN